MQPPPVDHASVFEGAGIDLESLTVVLVAGASRVDVLRALGAEAEVGAESQPDLDDEDWSAYAATEVSGGVVAFEHTGYADPSPQVVAALSGLGGAAAVTRSNIQAHERFGCARDGVLEFDADEFMYVEADEKDAVPPELRALFDSAWVDLDADDADADDGEGGDDDEAEEAWAGYAMAALHTGVVVTGDDLRRAVGQGYHRVRTLTYLD